MYILISVTLWSKIGVYISTLRLGHNLGKIVNLIYEPKNKNFEQKNLPKKSRKNVSRCHRVWMPT